jgi:hypothetical protein
MKIGINLSRLVPGYSDPETYVRGFMTGLALLREIRDYYVRFTNFRNYLSFAGLLGGFHKRVCGSFSRLRCCGALPSSSCCRIIRHSKGSTCCMRLTT